MIRSHSPHGNALDRRGQRARMNRKGDDRFTSREFRRLEAACAARLHDRVDICGLANSDDLAVNRVRCCPITASGQPHRPRRPNSRASAIPIPLAALEPEWGPPCFSAGFAKSDADYRITLRMTMDSDLKKGHLPRRMQLRNTELTAGTYAAVMDRQKEFVLRTLEERDIRFVRLWFTDVLGYLKSVAIAPAE